MNIKNKNIYGIFLAAIILFLIVIPLTFSEVNEAELVEDVTQEMEIAAADESSSVELTTTDVQLPDSSVELTDTQVEIPAFDYYGEDSKYYYPAMSITQDQQDEFCKQNQDFIIQVPVTGCTPAVVRSDLLEEQNVPVFCKLVGMKVNPLIEVPYIKDVNVNNYNQSPYIIAQTFHPPRSALKFSFAEIVGREPQQTVEAIQNAVIKNEESKIGIEGVPMLNDLGYVVLILKKQPVEAQMPDNITMHLEANIKYSITRNYGINTNKMPLKILTDEEWREQHGKYSFWNGQGYLRLIDLKEDEATIEVYAKDPFSKVGKVKLKVGKKNEKLFNLGDDPCAMDIKLRLDNIDFPSTKARLIVNGDELVLGKDDKILDSNCEVSSVNPSETDYGGEVIINCGKKSYVLAKRESGVEISFKKDGEVVKGIYSRGEELDDSKIYFVASGYYDDGQKFAVFVWKETKESGKESQEVSQKTEENREKIDETQDIVYTVEEIIRTFGTINKDLLDGKVKDKIDKTYEGLDKNYHFEIVDESEHPNFAGIEYVTIREAGLENLLLKAEIKKYYELTIKNYEDVVLSYKNIKKNDEGSVYSEQDKEFGLENDEENANDKYFGVEALMKSAELAEKLAQYRDEEEFLQSVIDNYKDSNSDSVKSILNDASVRLKNLREDDASQLSIVINDGKFDYYVYLNDIVKPSIYEQYARAYVNGELKMIAVGEQFGDWILKKISEKEIMFRNINAGSEDYDDEIYAQTNGKTLMLGEYTIRLVETHITKEAYVSIIPFSKDGETKTNFTINIGIEKRAIKISPEKTKEMIDKLNKTTKDLQNIVDKLNKTVIMWKKACVTGSAVIWAKNFATNLNGKARARKLVMRGLDGNSGWTAKCESSDFQKSIGVKTVSGCYQHFESQINNEVNKVQEKLQKANELVKTAKAKEGVITSKGIFNKITDERKYFDELGNEYSSGLNYEDIEYGELKVGKDEIKDVFDNLESLYDKNLITQEEATEMSLIIELVQDCSCKPGQQVASEDILCHEACSKVVTRFSKYSEYIDGLKEINDLTSNLKIQLGEDILVIPTLSEEKYNDRLPVYNIRMHLLEQQFFGGKEQNCNVDGGLYCYVTFFINNADENDKSGLKDYGSYMAFLQKKNDGSYTVVGGSVYELQYTGNVLNSVIKVDEANYKKIIKKYGLNNIKPIEIKNCENPFLKENLEVKFYESGPYKGLVAFMPVDQNKGWYAATLAYNAGSSQESYQDSGAINSFYLCNIGPNQKPEFNVAGTDDNCMEIPLATSSIKGISLCSLTELESKKLIENAITCMNDAAKAYQRGDRIIRTTPCGNFNIGKPPVQTTSVQCEDLMSPTDCKIMYNLCDPVICPSSRCDWGGRYPVNDVVQSGVIGSLVLCSQNFENGQGVLVPVCMSGVYAGLDAFTSVLKASQDCLKESLETGQTVGICDEIRSVYICQLFWSELTPLLKAGIPAITDKFVNNGGGEYAFLSDSIKSLEQSVNYFTDYYGENSFKAFKVRSTAETGSYLCDKFISVRYPDAVSLLNDLSQPEVPLQYSAWFDERAYQSITVPATSSYHVTYWIYAGREEDRIYYDIYLKADSDKGYYIQQEKIKVDSGYLDNNGYKFEKKDLIAPSGYKKLCIRINAGEENCDFGKVSTSFAVNELSDYYVYLELNKSIDSSSECRSGTPSLIPTISLNLQTQIENALNPELWRTGINRRCSTDNPSGSVDRDRWKKVGYCDVKEIGCWIDTESIKDAINDVGLEEAAYEEAKSKDLYFLEQEGFWSKEYSLVNLTSVDAKRKEFEEEVEKGDLTLKEMKIKASDIVALYEEIIKKSLYPYFQASSQIGIAETYEIVARYLYLNFKGKCSEAGGDWVDFTPVNRCKAGGILGYPKNFEDGENKEGQVCCKTDYEMNLEEAGKLEGGTVETDLSALCTNNNGEWLPYALCEENNIIKINNVVLDENYNNFQKYPYEIIQTASTFVGTDEWRDMPKVCCKKTSELFDQWITEVPAKIEWNDGNYYANKGIYYVNKGIKVLEVPANNEGKRVVYSPADGTIIKIGVDAFEFESDSSEKITRAISYIVIEHKNDVKNKGNGIYSVYIGNFDGLSISNYAEFRKGVGYVGDAIVSLPNVKVGQTVKEKDIISEINKNDDEVSGKEGYYLFYYTYNKNPVAVDMGKIQKAAGTADKINEKASIKIKKGERLILATSYGEKEESKGIVIIENSPDRKYTIYVGKFYDLNAKYETATEDYTLSTNAVYDKYIMSDNPIKKTEYYTFLEAVQINWALRKPDYRKNPLCYFTTRVLENDITGGEDKKRECKQYAKDVTTYTIDIRETYVDEDNFLHIKINKDDVEVGERIKIMIYEWDENKNEVGDCIIGCGGQSNKILYEVTGKDEETFNLEKVQSRFAGEEFDNEKSEIQIALSGRGLNEGKYVYVKIGVLPKGARLEKSFKKSANGKIQYKADSEIELFTREVILPLNFEGYFEVWPFMDLSKVNKINENIYSCNEKSIALNYDNYFDSGSDIKAPAEGYIIYSDYFWGYDVPMTTLPKNFGRLVIKHSDNLYTVYRGGFKPFGWPYNKGTVKAVKAGDIIANMISKDRDVIMFTTTEDPVKYDTNGIPVNIKDITTENPIPHFSEKIYNQFLDKYVVDSLIYAPCLQKIKEMRKSVDFEGITSTPTQIQQIEDKSLDLKNTYVNTNNFLIIPVKEEDYDIGDFIKCEIFDIEKDKLNNQLKEGLVYIENNDGFNLKRDKGVFYPYKDSKGNLFLTAKIEDSLSNKNELLIVIQSFNSRKEQREEEAKNPTSPYLNNVKKEGYLKLTKKEISYDVEYVTVNDEGDIEEFTGNFITYYQNYISNVLAKEGESKTDKGIIGQAYDCKDTLIEGLARAINNYNEEYNTDLRAALSLNNIWYEVRDVKENDASEENGYIQKICPAQANLLAGYVASNSIQIEPEDMKPGDFLAIDRNGENNNKDGYVAHIVVFVGKDDEKCNGDKPYHFIEGSVGYSTLIRSPVKESCYKNWYKSYGSDGEPNDDLWYNSDKGETEFKPRRFKFNEIIFTTCRICEDDLISRFKDFDEGICRDECDIA